MVYNSLLLVLFGEENRLSPSSASKYMVYLFLYWLPRDAFVYNGLQNCLNHVFAINILLASQNSMSHLFASFLTLRPNSPQMLGFDSFSTFAFHRPTVINMFYFQV